jgi:hypothetical protein
MSEASQKEADFRTLRSDMSQFFSQFWVLSRRHAPPAPNAASGGFVTAVLTDDTLLRFLQSRGFIDQEANRIDAIFREFVRDTLRSFEAGDPGRRGLHSADWTSSHEIFMTEFNVYKGLIIDSVTTIIHIVTGDEPDLPGDVVNILVDINNILKHLSSNYVTHGEHGNGWIAPGVQEAAKRAFRTIHHHPEYFRSKYAKGVSNVFLESTRLIYINLPTHNDPWLRADWQLGFAALCGTAGSAFALLPKKYRMRSFKQLGAN